jgi:uncharacterized protein (UPF0305 family)
MENKEIEKALKENPIFIKIAEMLADQIRRCKKVDFDNINYKELSNKAYDKMIDKALEFKRNKSDMKKLSDKVWTKIKVKEITQAMGR